MKNTIQIMAATVDLTLSSDDEKFNTSQSHNTCRGRRQTEHPSPVFDISGHIHLRVRQVSPVYLPLDSHVSHDRRVQSTPTNLGRKDMSHRRPTHSSQSASSRRFDDLTGGRLSSPPPKSQIPLVPTVLDNHISKNQILGGGFYQSPIYSTSEFNRIQNEPVVRNGADHRANSTPIPLDKQSSSPRPTEEKTRSLHSTSRMNEEVTGTPSPAGWLPKLPRAARKGFIQTRNPVASSPPNVANQDSAKAHNMVSSPLTVHGFNGALGIPTDRPYGSATKAARKRVLSNQATEISAEVPYEAATFAARKRAPIAIATASNATPVPLHRQPVSKAVSKEALNGIDAPPIPLNLDSHSPAGSISRMNGTATHQDGVHEELEAMETSSMIIDIDSKSPTKAAMALQSDRKPTVPIEVVPSPQVQQTPKASSTSKDVGSKIPLSLEEFEKVLQRYLVNLHAAHECHVKVSFFEKGLGNCVD